MEACCEHSAAYDVRPRRLGGALAWHSWRVFRVRLPPGQSERVQRAGSAVDEIVIAPSFLTQLPVTDVGIWASSCVIYSTVSPARDARLMAMRIT